MYVRTSATLGVGLVAGVAVAAALAPWISPFDPKLTTAQPFATPSAAHWLGANDVGQDILSELLWGGRVSLSIGALAGVIGTVTGTTLGLLAGYFRGWVDALCMRAVDVVLVIPFLPLMIVLAAYVGPPSVVSLAVVIGLLVWARPARVVRSLVLSLAARDHIFAARA